MTKPQDPSTEVGHPASGATGDDRDAPSARTAKVTRLVHVVLGLVVAVLGVVLTVMSLTGLDYLGANDTPGPGFFPSLVSAILAALGIALALTWTLMPAGRRESAPQLSFVPRQMIRVAVVWAGLGVFTALMEPLGFLVASELFALFLIVAVERIRDWRMAVTLVLLPLVTYFLFATLLEVDLPGGTLWS